MGEVFFRRIFFVVFLALFLVLFTGISFAGVHPLYSGFSSAGSGFNFNNASNLVSASDTAVYKIGYYSVNGGAWQSFVLSGTSYNGDVNWLSGSSSYTLPAFGFGEHYVIVYSCAYVNNGWDCYDNRWQLVVVNNSQVIVSNCSDNCSGLGFQCGVQSVCGNSVDCGNCSTGYTCNANGMCIINCMPQASSACYNDDVYWYDSCGVVGGLRFDCNASQVCSNGVCVNSQPGNCGGQTCKTNEYCSNNVCLLNVSGNTYFVATNGSDSNPGTFAQPWKTWQKAFTSTSVNPGDVVYFRGGVYPTTVKTGLGIEATRSGTESNWIIYMNYPGETPILDCGNIVQSDIQYTGLRNVGVEFSNIYYVKLVGLTVRNVKQYYDRNFGVGIRVSGGNMILERCTVYNIWGHGFETWFGDRAGDKVYFINCDAYNCNDLISGNPLGSNAGNTGAGFSLWDSGSNALGEVYLYNCRAWNTSDQGFQTGASHYVKAVGCWSFENRAYGMGGGTGWKMGWMDYEAQPKEMYNNLAACNDGSGFLTNEWYGVDIPSTKLYNNLVYKNGLVNGFGVEISRLESGYTNDELLRVFKNNIAYGNINQDIFTYDNSQYTHDHNSWDSSVSVNDNDFVSLNCSQLYAPRKADGSLPDVTFGHLRQGSDLIDAGVVVPGYHCSSAGAHPGEGCVEWFGSAPDLGPFESNY